LYGNEALTKTKELNKKYIHTQDLSNNSNFRSGNNGTIDYTKILEVIDTAGVSNYTFKIINHPEDSPNIFHNLVISQKVNETQERLLIKYENENLSRKIIEFKGEITIKNISTLTNPCDDTTAPIDFVDGTGPINGGGGPGPGPGDGNVNNPIVFFPTNNGSGGSGHLTVSDLPNFICNSPGCHFSSNTWEGFSQHVDLNGQIYPFTIVMRFSQAVASGSINPCDPNGDIGILDEEDECSSDFMANLLPDQKLRLDQQKTNNAPIFSEILNYVARDVNGCSYERNTFAKEIIERIMIDSTFTSVNPFIIEKQINSNQLDPCSQGVLQQVENTTNNDFVKVLAKLGADGSIYNTTMISEAAPSGAPAQTKWNSPYNYTIYISTDYVDKTKLFIAASMFHELVHAYFMSLFDDYYNGSPQIASAYDDFPILFQKYVDKTYPGSSDIAHHEQMALQYLDAIASAIKEYAIKTGTSSAFPNLDQICNDLAWGGLKDAPIFNVLYPLGNAERLRIIYRYTCESIGIPYGTGTVNGQTPIGQPCN